MNWQEKIQSLKNRIQTTQELLQHYTLTRNLAAEVADGLIRSTHVTQQQAIKLRNDYRQYMAIQERRLAELQYELLIAQSISSEVA